MKLKVECALALALILAPLEMTSAQNADEMAALRSNCRADYFRFCAGMSTGGPEVRACFKQNRANLSQACAAAMKAYEAKKASDQTSR